MAPLPPPPRPSLPLGRAVATVLALAGCGASQSRTLRPIPAAGTTGQVEELVRQAFALDAAGDRGADTLYAPEALIVANARLRLGAPRFAGVGLGGRVTVAAATVTLQGRLAWVMVDYRWINAERRLAEVGRATFICEEKAGGWKIVHVHSSQPLPWER